MENDEKQPENEVKPEEMRDLTLPEVTQVIRVIVPAMLEAIN